AVKLLSERYPADAPAAQRFLSEARITGQLQHPGIPAVHQVGTLADGRPFLAMKLIRGSTLEALLKQRTDPSAERGRWVHRADRGAASLADQQLGVQGIKAKRGRQGGHGGGLRGGGFISQLYNAAD